MSKMVFALAVLGLGFALALVCGGRMDGLADKFAKESLRLQQHYAESVKSFEIDRVYVFDNTSFFDGAMIVIHNNVRVRTRENRFAVLSEAAQAVLDMTSYKEFSDGAELKSDEIGYYI